MTEIRKLVAVVTLSDLNLMGGDDFLLAVAVAHNHNIWMSIKDYSSSGKGVFAICQHALADRSNPFARNEFLL